jgi:hypothetical protein
LKMLKKNLSLLRLPEKLEELYPHMNKNVFP